MQKVRNFLRPAAVTFLACFIGSLAFGQATRTWVSGVGDDANPCSRTAPCKTFAGAIGKTAAGGEIDVLDPGGFGAVTITKSISIEADGVIAGVLAAGTNGITVAAGPTDTVVIRGLTFDGLNGLGLNGVKFTSGGSLFVEDCRINSFGAGILVEPTAGSSRVFISNTTLRDSGDGILIAPVSPATVSATLDKVRAQNNPGVGLSFGGFGGTVKALIENSTSAGNGTGIAASGATTTVILTGDTVFGNPLGDISSVANAAVIPEAEVLSE
jgi:hypothetical protein